MSINLANLQKKLGYTFQDPKLLERALTHRSWAYEQRPGGKEPEVRDLHNETFEFVGDAVLGLAVVEEAFKKWPNATEGELTLMKHRLVSAEILAKNAQKLGLGEFLRIGRGEEKTGGRGKQALLANALEAIIGAVFMDSGYTVARNFVINFLADDLRDVSPLTSVDYKTLLQETLQSQKRTGPKYKVVKTEGPPHKRSFLVEAEWDSGTASGEGSSIKSAEMAAANMALKLIKEQIKSEKRIKNS